MQIIKYITLILILSLTSYIGILISKKYLNRVKDLKEMKNALNMFSAKIKFTYEPIPQTFKEISQKTKPNISNIFKKIGVADRTQAAVFAIRNNLVDIN